MISMYWKAVAEHHSYFLNALYVKSGWKNEQDTQATVALTKAQIHLAIGLLLNYIQSNRVGCGQTRSRFLFKKIKIED